MKAHVQTPPRVAARMTELLFSKREPDKGDRILYPGCGLEAPFISAVSDYCEIQDVPIPEGIAYETHPERFESVRDLHREAPVKFRREDFLQDSANLPEFEYVIGNPPYVQIEDIDKKEEYKRRFKTARGRFDLYILFFEQAIEVLKEGGRLSFITPEKFEYTKTGKALRQLLVGNHIERIEHRPEDLFTSYATYPAITILDKSNPRTTTVRHRDGSIDTVSLPTAGDNWAPVIRGIDGEVLDSNITLDDVTERISPGVATGRDGIFVQSRDSALSKLIEEDWVYPTTSGKQLSINDGPHSDDVIICPYNEEGNLAREDDLGVYLEWANLHRPELESRSCVQNGKPWYSWHENPPMDDVIGRPKIVYADLSKEPKFWIDEDGEVLPRHSVYYMIPREGVDIHALKNYLEEPEARAWLESRCQRASNGYYRFQSSIIKDLPVPELLADTIKTSIG